MLDLNHSMMAIDQYGYKVSLRGKHPRKELLSALGYKHADKVYIDSGNETKHIGYIVNRRWFTLYNRWERKA